MLGTCHRNVNYSWLLFFKASVLLLSFFLFVWTFAYYLARYLVVGQQPGPSPSLLFYPGPYWPNDIAFSLLNVCVCVCDNAWMKWIDVILSFPFYFSIHLNTGRSAVNIFGFTIFVSLFDLSQSEWMRTTYPGPIFHRW